MKLILNENLSPVHAVELRSLGYDACAVVEVGLSGAIDEEIRRFACDEGRILVTLDADFANVMRFPPQQTQEVVRLTIHPPAEAKFASPSSGPWSFCKILISRAVLLSWMKTKFA